MGSMRWILLANFATKLFVQVLEFIAKLNGGEENALKARAAEVVSPDLPDVQEIDEQAFPYPKAPG